MGATPFDVITGLGAEFLSESRLPSGTSLVQLRYKGTRFSVKGLTPDELMENAVRRVCALETEKQGGSRELGVLCAERLLDKMRGAPHREESYNG